jgi:hypothetical protein
MSYAILRVEKLKTPGNIAGSLAHTFRTRETPNADLSLASLNEHHGPQTPEAVMASIRDALPEKRRSDAVLCLEYFIGASPEHFKHDEGRQYFDDARKWLEARHGAENVISTHVHRDETSPHMVAYVVPLVDGRLNAKQFTGGKTALSKMQTEFAQEVGRQHGLERGIEGSRATHQTIKEFYAHLGQVEQQVASIVIPTEREVVHKGLLTSTLEADDAYAQRVANVVRERMAPALKKAAQTDLIAKREREQARAVNHHKHQAAEARKSLAKWERLVSGLAPDQVAQLLATVERQAERMREAARVVVGWLRGGRAEVDGRYTLTIQERGTGKTVEMVHRNERVAERLNEAGVKIGDLVEVSQAGDAKILERGQQQTQERDPGRGR